MSAAIFVPQGIGLGMPQNSAPPPAPPPFKPTFVEDVEITVPDEGDVKGGTFRYNSEYFATAETADYLVKRYGLVGAIAVPVSYGMYTVNVPQEMVVLPNGSAYPAGLLAQAFVEWPEDKDPGVADTWVRQAIANLLARK